MHLKNSNLFLGTHALVYYGNWAGGPWDFLFVWGKQPLTGELIFGRLRMLVCIIGMFTKWRVYQAAAAANDS